jgi:endonuclease/exonuclease/phosphatase family metal-dependent hydrolase
MPRVPPPSAGFDPAPAECRRVLADLERALDDAIPAKVVDRNLLIATWNVKHFGRVNKRWATGRGQSPKRNLHDLCCIAEIVSRFDVVALVEVKRNLEALRLLMEILGPEWGFIVSDPVEGEPGNDERLGFVFDLRRVRPSGLAGEFVVPDADLGEETAVMRRQWARTPYAVSFQAGGSSFTLVTLHILWGDRPSDRTPELRGAAKWLAQQADEPDEFNRNMIALGDFNIDRLDDPNWHAFVVEYGLSPPDKLLGVPRTVGETPTSHTFYDQIAWFTTGGRSALTLRYRDAGGFTWTDHLLAGIRQTEKEARISDHYPLWAEFWLREES